LPAPLVEITGQEDVVGPPAYRKYFFRISNALAYPDEIFALAPDLPPCGMIATASRTWVDVYTTTDGQNRFVQNYCELSGHSDLEGLSFVAQLTDLPEAVFVELNDRREAKVYRSAAVALSGGGLPPVASVVWQRQYFVEEAELLADADGDGYATWAEGQFGTDPRSSDSAPVVRVVSYGVGGAQVFWNSVAGARVQPETTTTLGSWQPLGDPLTGNGLAMGIALPESQSPRFVRLRALPLLDEDSDGLNSLDEALVGTDHLNADTDGDGASDREEVMVLKTNPLRGVEVPVLDALPGAVSAPTLAVAGQAEAGDMITVSGGTLPVSVMSGATGAFSATVTLNTNRLNRLSVSSRNAAGQTGPVRTVEVIHDAQPPALHVDFPGNNAELYTETATIAGRVADSLSGYQGLSVTVNGQPANVMVGIGTNGTYERASVPLTVGENPITVVARDAHGNTTTKTIMLYRADPVSARILAVSGAGQTGMVHRRMATPIEVEVRDSSNQPWPGKVVKFTVIRSDGRLAPSATHPTAGELILQAITDAAGRARGWWVLGSDAGCGNNRVEVTTDGISGSAYFCASANPGPASQINIGSGNTQTSEVNGFVSEPLRVWVSDACNGIPGVAVTFRVTRGWGKVNGQDAVTVPTTRTGHAQVDFQIGPDPGNHVIEATYPGFTGSPAVFTLRGLARTPEQGTSFTAIAQDNAGQPIGGANAFIKVAGQLIGPVASTLDGVIAFTALPAAGAAELLVDAKSATSLGGQSVPAGSFPALNFQMTLVANAANEHPGPILFPKLNPANAVKYDGTHDVMLECQGIEGLQFIVRAGSMTRANGTKPSAANPEFLSINQVAHDDVPMPMPDGASPPFAWTFQPAGAIFNPPVEIRYPNMSGLAPGSIAYFLSYDHAVEKFDIVSSGHVTPDGAHIVTDPGSGLTLSGWGCNCPPYSVVGEIVMPGVERIISTEFNCNQAPPVGPQKDFKHKEDVAFTEVGTAVNPYNLLTVGTGGPTAPVTVELRTGTLFVRSPESGAPIPEPKHFLWEVRRKLTTEVVRRGDLEKVLGNAGKMTRLEIDLPADDTYFTTSATTNDLFNFVFAIDQQEGVSPPDGKIQDNEIVDRRFWIRVIDAAERRASLIQLLSMQASAESVAWPSSESRIAITTLVLFLDGFSLFAYTPSAVDSASIAGNALKVVTLNQGGPFSEAVGCSVTVPLYQFHSDSGFSKVLGSALAKSDFLIGGYSGASENENVPAPTQERWSQTSQRQIMIEPMIAAKPFVFATHWSLPVGSVVTFEVPVEIAPLTIGADAKGVEWHSTWVVKDWLFLAFGATSVRNRQVFMTLERSESGFIIRKIRVLATIDEIYDFDPTILTGEGTSVALPIQATWRPGFTSGGIYRLQADIDYVWGDGGDEQIPDYLQLYRKP
jgi:hypothetical protein